MKAYKNKKAFTIVEILIVIVLVAILASMIITVATRLNTQTKIKLTQASFAVVDAAIEQFRDYGYKYRVNSALYSPAEVDFYNKLDFPPDCNGFDAVPLQSEIAKVLNTAVIISEPKYDYLYSGSSALYFFLSRVPDSRETLERFERTLITDEDSAGNSMVINVNGRNLPLYRFIDPWGKSLRYDCYDENLPFSGSPYLRKDSKKVFPVITSAGPDGTFGTRDDITNEQ